MKHNEKRPTNPPSFAMHISPNSSELRECYDDNECGSVCVRSGKITDAVAFVAQSIFDFRQAVGDDFIVIDIHESGKSEDHVITLVYWLFRKETCEIFEVEETDEHYPMLRKLIHAARLDASRNPYFGY